MAKRKRIAIDNSESHGRYQCPACKQWFSSNDLKYKKIQTTEVNTWKEQFPHMTSNHVNHKPCYDCHKRIRSTDTNESKRLKTSASQKYYTHVSIHNDTLALIKKLQETHVTQSVSQIINMLAESHDSLMQLRKESTQTTDQKETFTCSICQMQCDAFWNHLTVKQEAQRNTATSSITPDNKLHDQSVWKHYTNLQVRNDGIYLPVRANDNKLGKLLMEYLSAKLQHKKVNASNINDIIQVVCEVLGIKLNGELPSLQQHIYITHRFSIYSDMYYYFQTYGKHLCLNTDDFSRKWKAFQVMIFTSQNDSGTMQHHLAGIYRIPAKTVQYLICVIISSSFIRYALELRSMVIVNMKKMIFC